MDVRIVCTSSWEEAWERCKLDAVNGILCGSSEVVLRKKL